jgi:hypothetical protein
MFSQGTACRGIALVHVLVYISNLFPTMNLTLK